MTVVSNVTKRTSQWYMDDKGNVSHYSHVGREDELNKRLREEGNENAKELIDKNREKARVEDKQKTSSSNMIWKQGVTYEKTIPDSISMGFSFIQSIEKQLSGTKFFVGTVSYGQTYGNSSDTNFVINPHYLERLATEEDTRKQFEEDVKYLYDFSQRFHTQQLSQGREIVSQGWFCDENGNWGGWSISKPVNTSHVLQDMTDYLEKIR